MIELRRTCRVDRLVDMRIINRLAAAGLCICIGASAYGADEAERAKQREVAESAASDEEVVLFDAGSALAPDQEATSLNAAEAKHLAFLRTIHKSLDSMSVLPPLNLRALNSNFIAVIVPGGARLRFTGKRASVPEQKDNYVWSGKSPGAPWRGQMTVAFSAAKEPSLVGSIRGGEKTYSVMGLAGDSRHYVLIDHVVRPSYHQAVREPSRAK